MRKAEDYFDEVLKGRWPLVSLSGESLESRCLRLIRDGLLNLDKLPRSDPFWDNTNKEATVYKLADYSADLSEKHPRSPDGPWLGIALAVLYCANDFGSEGFKSLQRLDSDCFEVALPIEAAYAVYARSFFDTSSHCALTIREMGLVQAALDYIEDMKPSDVGRLKWFDSLRDKLMREKTDSRG
jgi:hypothetical protein